MRINSRNATLGGLAGTGAQTYAINRLLAPKGRFQLMLRLYWPSEPPPSIIDGTWSPPPAKKVA